MSSFICPKCKSPLTQRGTSLYCSENHCYDISKRGYVNLLLSQKSSLHGDNKLMVRARRDFLEAGYYAPLADKIADTIASVTSDGCVICDAGCGEGYYLGAMKSKLDADGKGAHMIGIDISGDALSYAGRRGIGAELAVASVYDMPLPDASCDIVTSIFSPFAADEFMRVLKRDGYLLRVFPLEKHLWELKSAVYDTPYENKPEPLQIPGFELGNHTEVRGKISLLDGESIKNLFSMTPYRYNTSPKDLQKLDAIESLDITTEFALALYKKS